MLLVELNCAQAVHEEMVLLSYTMGMPREPQSSARAQKWETTRCRFCAEDGGTAPNRTKEVCQMFMRAKEGGTNRWVIFKLAHNVVWTCCVNTHVDRRTKSCSLHGENDSEEQRRLRLKSFVEHGLEL